MKEIIENYKYSIKKIIRNITGSNNEDVEQEVYIKTWKNIDKYQETGKFQSWINTLTANMCRDYLRSSQFQKKSQTCTIEDNVCSAHASIPSPENKMISKYRQEKTLNAIDELKPKLKEVIVLYEMQGLNYEEISKKIKCPIGTVKSRLYKARQELSISLKDLL